LDHGADITLLDNEGWNALDIAIIKMNYEAALLLKKAGLDPKD
jgi:ankyrin repeat protein